MKIKKVGKLLKKMNNLYENMREEGSVSTIEKDLFLNYIRQLYEHAIDADAEEDPSEQIVADKAQVAVTPPTANEDVNKALAKSAESEPQESKSTAAANQEEDRRAAERARRETERKARQQDREQREAERAARKRSEESLAHEQEPEDQGKALEDVKDVKVESKISAQEPAAKAPITVTTNVVSEELEELFTIEGIKDVSDRLRMQPISDMNRCMGINERIFTIRELFGGDDNLFNTTMDHLNTLSDYDTAKDYLASGVATTHEWIDVSKTKKAGNFIKLVYRRYL